MKRGSMACPAMPPWVLTHLTMAVAWARASPRLSRPLRPAAWLSVFWLVATKKPMRTVVGVTPRGSGPRGAPAAATAPPGVVPACPPASPAPAAAPAPGPPVADDAPGPAAPVAPGAAVADEPWAPPDPSVVAAAPDPFDPP